ncbi:2,3-diaminopropionate biosynthesis protein SbnB [Actinokineospora enzanensis]|uniref:2,3-diaminopropionate biosynthesis protein SbnB n=1 Tax=Actinokineospora enzanensis TaxID=155975 RepID=UPI000525B2D4
MDTPTFTTVSGRQVAEILRGRHAEVVGLVRDSYLAHGEGRTVNPPSAFLRFPDRPRDRVIALPAALETVNGVKWISSRPGNLDLGLPRAAAVLVLNDPVTGFPYACLEGAVISASRTAASAALAARVLTEQRGTRPTRLGIIGAGLIARYIHEYLDATGWRFDRIAVHDLHEQYAHRFAEYLDADVSVHTDPGALIESSDLVVFATTATTPHIGEQAWFRHHPLVLHVSLRDLTPELILDCHNVLDDIDHCLAADTSVHLAEQHCGDRRFVHGSMYDALTTGLAVPRDRTVVFSPFGMGVLDLAVGRFVHREGTRLGLLDPVPDFFSTPAMSWTGARP